MDLNSQIEHGEFKEIIKSYFPIIVRVLYVMYVLMFIRKFKICIFVSPINRSLFKHLLRLEKNMHNLKLLIKVAVKRFHTIQVTFIIWYRDKIQNSWLMFSVINVLNIFSIIRVMLPFEREKSVTKFPLHLQPLLVEK